MVSQVSQAPARPPAREVTFGRASGSVGLRFGASSMRVFNDPGTLDRIATGAAAIDRAARKDAHPGTLAGFERGILTGTELKDWRSVVGYLEFNQGLQFRTGRGSLPYAVTNYGSVTSDESIAGAVAAGWRRHDLVSAVGSTSDQLYTGLGHKFYDYAGGSGAPVVAATMTDVITCLAHLNVNGTLVVAVATNGTTDDIKYTTDPTAGTITWTTLVALSASDHVTAMRYISTLGAGANLIVGTVGGTNGVWWQDTATAAAWTLEPCVLTATKDQVNTANTVQNTGAIRPHTALAGKLGAMSSVGQAWTNEGEILDDDGTYATAPTINSGTGQAIGGLYDFRPYVPPGGVELTGLEHTYERLESDAAANQTAAALFLAAVLMDQATDVNDLSGTILSVNKADAAEFAATVETITTGSSTDLWGTAMALADWRSPNLGVFLALAAAVAGHTISVEDWTATLYYRRTGASAGFGKGWMIDRHPLYPERISIVDDADEVWHLDFVWQADQERPTFGFTQGNEGMSHVWAACPYQDGYAYAGGSASEPGYLLKHERPDGVLNYSFPQKHGDYDVRINAMTRADDWLILEVVHYTAGTTTVVDLQKWFFTTVPDRAFCADTLLQSLSNNLAIAAAPPPASVMLTNPDQDLMYSIFPNGTDTAFRAERVQPDLGADPLFVNTGWTRSMAWTNDGGWAENTGLQARTPRLNIGPPEALKAFTVVRYGDRLISAASGASRGAVTVDVDTTGDRTLASPAVSHQFTSAYEEYQVPDGAAYQDAIVRLTVAHDAGTAETPAVCPIDFETQQKWPTEVWIAFTIAVLSVEDWFKFIAQFQALEETTKPIVQELIVGNLRDAPADYTDPTATLGPLAVCEGFPGGLQPQMRVPPPGEPVTFVNPKGETKVEPTILFRLVRGATS